MDSGSIGFVMICAALVFFMTPGLSYFYGGLVRRKNAVNTMFASVITIGTGTQQYPLVNRCCRPVTACGVRTRTRYSTCVETSATSAVFKMLGEPCCQPNNNLRSVNGTAPVADTPTGGDA